MSNKTIKIIFIGDTVGKLGRAALAKVVPEWKAKYQPDDFIVNVENLAHGKGVTEGTLGELQALGLHIFTGGNHIWSKENLPQFLHNPAYTLVIPANDSRSTEQWGARPITIAGQKFLLVNLLGQVFMEDGEKTNPFLMIDQILANTAKENYLGVIVDLHAEATSEKIAFGWHVDGRVSAVFGTHTHVPTADTKILPNGTAYVTDIGMVAGTETVLGVKKELVLSRFLQGNKGAFDYPDTGPAEVNAILFEVDAKTGKAVSIERLQENVVL